MTDLPSYAELPEAPHGGRTSWGVFGADDNLGTVSLMTPERIVAAAGLIQKGKVFALDVELGYFAPALAAFRGEPRHQLLHFAGELGFDDVYDNVYPQAGSQWDALGHCGYKPDMFYNGATEADIIAGRRNTIEHWTEHGMAGRAVVLDVPGALAEAGIAYTSGDAFAITVEHLELARARAGVDYQPGDTLILYTGYAEWYKDQPVAVRKALHGGPPNPGLEHSEAMCEYMWNTHAAAIGSDNFAVEMWPADESPEAEPFGLIHQMLIGAFGMALGELWWLKDLVDDCRTDGRYEGFFVSTPWNAPGAVGSPANAVVIK